MWWDKVTKGERLWRSWGSNLLFWHKISVGVTVNVGDASAVPITYLLAAGWDWPVGDSALFLVHSMVAILFTCRATCLRFYRTILPGDTWDRVYSNTHIRDFRKAAISCPRRSRNLKLWPTMSKVGFCCQKSKFVYSFMRFYAVRPFKWHINYLSMTFLTGVVWFKSVENYFWRKTQSKYGKYASLAMHTCSKIIRM